MKERLDQLQQINQRQVLSQSLLYFLKILAMNNLELRTYISNAVEENPFLQERHDYYIPFSDEFPDKSDCSNELFQEMAFLRLSKQERKIAEILINGATNYLDNELLKQISQEEGISYSKLLDVIHKLKKTSFSGVFSFNFRDKLKTLLENAGYQNIRSTLFVENIDFALSGDWGRLKTKCNLSDWDLSRMLSVLKGFFASSRLDEHIIQYRNIDMIIEKEPQSNVKVSMEESLLPGVHFDRDLYTQSLRKSRSDLDKKYVKSNATNAKLLIKSISARSSTLLKITQEIARRQMDFFSGETPYPNPISIKSLSYLLFMHESTISRAISNKTAATPRGILELKSLFPRKIKSYDDKTSDYSIKEYIKQLINNEPKDSPYSDNNIMHFLNMRGITISRRTISKYRNSLNIPNTIERIKSYSSSCTYLSS